MKKRVFVLLGFLIFSQLSFSQEKKNYQLTSPYHTISTHIDNLQPDNFNPEIAAKTLNAYGYSQKAKEKLAIKLKQVLDGKGFYVVYEDLPHELDYEDSTRNKNVYLISETDPRIYVEKIGNAWYYSRETVQNINTLHKEVYPYGLDKVLELIPQNANLKFLGLTTWQYVGLLLLLILAFILHRILSFFFQVLLYRFFSKIRRVAFVKKVVQSTARPASLFVLFWLLAWVVPVLRLPVFLNKYLFLFIDIATPVFAVMIALRLVDFISAYMEKAALKTEEKLDDQLIPLVKKAFQFLIIVIGIIYALHKLNFNVTALLTGLSIGGLAFALAAQDTIKNLFGSLTIFLDRPFQVGDWVVADGIDGSIEEVGFRSTRVRTFHDSLIYVPNGRMADMTIDNMGLRKYRRYKTVLSLTYDTPPVLIEAYIKGLRQIVQTHPNTQKERYHIYLNKFSSSSLDILFYIFFGVATWEEELEAKHEVMLQAIKLADELGVRFAFPTQTIHIEDLPGQNTLTPHYSKEGLETKKLDEKINDFIEKNKITTKDKPKRMASRINEEDEG